MAEIACPCRLLLTATTPHHATVYRHQALCNVLWAFDTLGRRHLPLLRAAALCIVRGHRTRCVWARR